MLREVQALRALITEKQHDDAPADVAGVAAWTVDDVGIWLSSVGLGRHQPLFASHGLAGVDLIDLSNDDLKSIGLLVLHDRKAVLRETARLLRNAK